jgi:putative nucleotidyltransferase with HDIG domain
MLIHFGAVMFKKLKSNPLTKFFVRSFAVLMVMIFIGLGGAYYFLEREATQHLNSVMQKAHEFLEQEFLNLSKSQQEDPSWFIKTLEQLAKEQNALRVEVLNAAGMPTFNYESSPLTAELEKTFNAIQPDKDKAFTHAVIPGKNKEIILIYTEELLFTPLEQMITVKVAMPISKEQLQGLRKILRVEVITALITVLLVVIALFPVVYSLYRDLNKSREALLLGNIDMLKTLGNAIAQRDSDTHSHNYRVTFYAVRLAEKLNLPKKDFPSLIKGAFLHDIGKIGIPDAILLKPGKLDQDEFAVMKTHVELGIDTVKQAKWLEDAWPIIGSHHEKFDGSGYPRGLKGNEIPEVARIFSVVDVFDALSSSRPYKEAMPLDACMQIINEGKGKHFCPDTVKQFEKIVSKLMQETAGLQERELGELVRRVIAPYSQLL